MRVIIIGAGLAGLSAAITLSKENIESALVSMQASERAQSVMAEGGTNGALNTMGENDTPEEHFQDTLKAGAFIGDRKAIYGLTRTAPEILRELIDMGVPFNTKGETVQQRNFGGQKKKRTAYAKSSTGKALMSALIDEARKYEAKGLIERYPHHEFEELVLEDGICRGAVLRDLYSGNLTVLKGPVIMACGGLNGMFPEVTTGTVGNTGDAAATLFAQGVRFSNLEMIQYHPTTMRIPGKCCLVSEAARGEGGRLFIMRGGERWYFMEEKYPELGNLMPRDVVTRESFFAMQDENCGGQVYLDMHHLSDTIWKQNLSDLREEIQHYLGIDPAREPVPVGPGIHYFMGGIDVDVNHKTNLEQLFAAGECCSQYHGANRLGGNSTMGAMYGGRVAAESAAELIRQKGTETEEHSVEAPEVDVSPASGGMILELRDIMLPALGIVREGSSLEEAVGKIEKLLPDETWNRKERNRLRFAKAMLESALFRKESRGAHYRLDFPERKDAFAGATIAEFEKGTRITFRKIQ